MTPPRMLDLYCGAGGCARGYQEAGFHVTGVDNRPQPRYAGDTFVLGDALDYAAAHGHKYDAIHASPPCQAYTPLAALNPEKAYPDVVAATRGALVATARPWVIENVPGAPLHAPTLLCGTMFGLRVYRHRLFECPVLLLATARPYHPRHAVKAGGHKEQRQRKAHYVAGGFVTVTGNVGSYCGPAMGIDWMTGEELSQAIPPAYTRWLGLRLLAVLQRSEAGS